MNKQCKKLLNHLHECENFSLKYDDIKNLYFLRNSLEIEIQRMIDYIEKEGYISVNRTLSHDYMSVKLEYKGIHWKKFRYKEMLKYLQDKWIDFFAMITSVVALIISLISMLK